MSETRSRRRWWIAGIIVVVLAAAFFLLSGTEERADGAFDVPVILLENGQPLAPDRVRSVRYGSLHSKQFLGEDGQWPPEQDDSSYSRVIEKTAEARDGRWLLTIRFWARRWTSGPFVRSSHGHATALVVRVELTDGRRTTTVCPIRDMNEPQAIIIDLGRPSTQPATQPTGTSP